MRQLLIDKPEGLGAFPFLSLEEMTKQIFIKPEAPKEANVGDILLYNKNTSKMKLVKADESLDGYDSVVYSPVGVVMIPSNHDLYGTGEFTVISLDYMSCDTPDTGSTTELGMYRVGMYWGDVSYNIPELSNFTDEGYLPSTNKSLPNASSLCDDGKAKWSSNTPHLPSPFNADGTFNSNYFNTNCLSDVDGKSNTDIIISHVTVSWQSGSITRTYTTGIYPAACCCRRYSVLGTNTGDWYLGAAGEMGYMIARFQELQDSITKIRQKFSKGETLGASYSFWCSTEYSASNAYEIYPVSGNVTGTKKSNNFYARALLRVSCSQI